MDLLKIGEEGGRNSEWINYCLKIEFFCFLFSSKVVFSFFLWGVGKLESMSWARVTKTQKVKFPFSQQIPKSFLFLFIFHKKLRTILPISHNQINP